LKYMNYYIFQYKLNKPPTCNMNFEIDRGETSTLLYYK
jgi:hypothetical protein